MVVAVGDGRSDDDLQFRVNAPVRVETAFITADHGFYIIQSADHMVHRRKMNDHVAISAGNQSVCLRNGIRQRLGFAVAAREFIGNENYFRPGFC